jgi:hypothetical protein
LDEQGDLANAYKMGAGHINMSKVLHETSGGRGALDLSLVVADGGRHLGTVRQACACTPLTRMFSGKASPFVYVAMWAICTIHLDSGAHSRSFFVRGFVVSVVLGISGRGYFRYAKIARRPPDIYTLLHFSHQGCVHFAKSR